MKISDIILEAPITDLELLGNFNRSGPLTVRGGRQMVAHPAYIERATHAFRNTPFNFRIFISNVPGSAQGKGDFTYNRDRRLYERGILGKDGEDVRQLLSGIFKPEDVERILRNTADAITVIYAGNLGAELIPLTPWMLAHRLGHAISASSHRHTTWHTEVANYFWETINYTLREYYGARLEGSRRSMTNSEGMAMSGAARQLYLSLFKQIGTVSSIRQKNITRPYEFLYECLAQYLITGGVKLGDLPLTLEYGGYSYGRPNRVLRLKEQYRTEFDRSLDSFAAGLDEHFEDCLRRLTGNVLSI